MVAFTWNQSHAVSVLAIGYARVSTDKQADRGVSLEAQDAKIRAMAVVQGAELIDVIVDGGESAKNLNRPGMERLLAMVDARQVQTVIIAKLDRLTRSVKDLGHLLERLEKRGVALVSVAESLDTGSAAGRLVITIMTAVSQWEREAIGERTRDAMQHKRTNGECVGNIAYGYRLAADGEHQTTGANMAFSLNVSVCADVAWDLSAGPAFNAATGSISYAVGSLSNSPISTAFVKVLGGDSINGGSWVFESLERSPRRTSLT